MTVARDLSRILGPLRRLIPTGLGVDFSPMIAIAVLYVVGQFLG